MGLGLAAFGFSLPGKALHTLIGYTDQPTAMQLVVYLAILAVTFVLMRLYGRRRRPVGLRRRNNQLSRASRYRLASPHSTASRTSCASVRMPVLVLIR